MQPAGILETALYVDDLQSARAFYESVLGLDLVSVQEGRHVFFRCGPGMLLLFNPDKSEIAAGPVPPHGARGPGHAAFAIEPEEIGGWKAHLAQNEVEIEAEVQWPGGGHSLYFRDPAGNSLELATPATWS